MQRPPVQLPQVGRSLQAGVHAEGLVPGGIKINLHHFCDYELILIIYEFYKSGQGWSK